MQKLVAFSFKRCVHRYFNIDQPKPSLMCIKTVFLRLMGCPVIQHMYSEGKIACGIPVVEILDSIHSTSSSSRE